MNDMLEELPFSPWFLKVSGQLVVCLPALMSSVGERKKLIWCWRAGIRYGEAVSPGEEEGTLPVPPININVQDGRAVKWSSSRQHSSRSFCFMGHQRLQPCDPKGTENHPLQLKDQRCVFLALFTSFENLSSVLSCHKMAASVHRQRTWEVTCEVIHLF